MNNQMPYMYNPQGLPNNFPPRPVGGMGNLERRVERLERKVERLENKLSSINYRDDGIKEENDYSIYPPAVDNYML